MEYHHYHDHDRSTSYLLKGFWRSKQKKEKERPTLGRDVIIEATDGTPLAATIFESNITDPNLAKDVVIISAALGCKRGFYSRFAEWLKDTYNCKVVTFDYRGIGDSAPPTGLKGYDASILDWGYKDLEGVLRYSKSSLRPSQIKYVGHSNGFHICCLPSSHHLLEKVVGIAGHNPFIRSTSWDKNRLTQLLAWYAIFPTLVPLYGYLPAKTYAAFEDLPAKAAMNWRDWALQSDYILTDESRKKVYQQFNRPVMSLGFSDDELGTKEQMESFANNFRSADLKKLYIDPKEIGDEKIGHLGFFYRKHKLTAWPIVGDYLFPNRDGHQHLQSIGEKNDSPK